MPTELLIISTVTGLKEALDSYRGLEVLTAPRPAFALHLLASDRPPQAVYLDDLSASEAQIWEVVRAARARNVRVLVGLFGVALSQQQDLIDAGISVTTQAEATALAAWLAEQLGAPRYATNTRQALLAVAGAKGGIGKTLVVALLAEGLVRRGLRVLVVDGDLSNSGLIPTFRLINPPSYLELRQEGSGGWTPEAVRSKIIAHASGIHLLIGSEETADAQDLLLPEWQALMQAVRSLHDYDVVLLDTGPEIKKRPYAVLAAREGGQVILPAPPGRKERTGVGNVLRVFQNHVPDLTDRCWLLYMEPERGQVLGVEQIAPLFAQHFPQTRVLGTLPRAPRQVSLADEDPDRYLSPLDVAPHSRLSRAVHQVVETLVRELALPATQPMPRSSWWQRLRGERVQIRPPAPAPVAAEVRP